MLRCETCGGSGTILISSICRTCSGTAEIITYDDDGTENMEICPNCEDGLIYTNETCDICGGTGKVY